MGGVVGGVVGVAFGFFDFFGFFGFAAGVAVGVAVAVGLPFLTWEPVGWVWAVSAWTPGAEIAIGAAKARDKTKTLIKFFIENAVSKKRTVSTNTFANTLKPYWYLNDFIGFGTYIWKIGTGIDQPTFKLYTKTCKFCWF